MRTIAIINQKGGCGKTTTAINLAAAFSGAGQSTLLIDMDPQGHCALGLAVPEKQINSHIGTALAAPARQPVNTADLIWQVASGLDLIPATVALASAERLLANAPDKDLRLAQLLDRLDGDYRICLIDCPPSIGLLTFNALRAASEVIIPVETGFFALKGAIKQAATLRVIAQRVNHQPHLHVLATLYDVRTRHAREILGDLKRHFSQQLLPIPIHYSTKIKEAASFGQPIIEYASSCRGASDYRQLADYLIAHAPVRPQAPAERIPSPAEPQSPAPLVDRAAELVRRARALQQKTNAMQRRLESDPPASDARDGRSDSSADVSKKARRHLEQRLNKLLGAHQTDQGVLFCLPDNNLRQVHIAGDFNDWKPNATAMRRNEQLGIWELCLPLPPGRYRYRMVVDGKWVSDPHNQYVEANPFGELNSIIEIN